MSQHSINHENRPVSYLCKHLVRFFEKHAQNLNTPQNNLASWELQMGFSWAFKGLGSFLNLGVDLMRVV